jgi:hypothetical protein
VRDYSSYVRHRNERRFIKEMDSFTFLDPYLKPKKHSMERHTCAWRKKTEVNTGLCLGL